MEPILKYIDEIEKDVIAIRRFMHKHPEISGQEVNTQQFLKLLIEKEGLTCYKVSTGLYADLIIDENYKMIALRADIDALPISEQNYDLPYRSINDGVMHACGHDGHSAILYGVVKTLIKFKHLLKVNVRFIFQHDEEDRGGAKDFIKVGLLKDISKIYGLHLDNGLVTKTVSYKYGQTNAGGDVFKLKVIGKSAHAAYPHLSNSPVVCSSQIINSVQHIVSRNVSPLDSTVITFGKINGGTVYNSIPDVVELEGVIRNLNIDTQKYVLKRFKEVVTNISAAYNCEVEIEHIPSYPPLYNNDELVTKFVELSTQILGAKNVVEMKQPTLGLEDFAYYTHETDALFYRLGSRRNIDDEILNAHSETFNFDEKALKYGIILQTMLALSEGE